MYQVCISGSSKGKSVEEGRKLAEAAGKEVAKAGHALMTGATTGLPLHAAQAYKKAGGKTCVGVSPATSKVEHVYKYRLPLKPYDVIVYTGLHYVGRDAFLITSSDAVLSIGGRLGTLHEAMIALETDTPIAFLEGVSGTTNEIRDILKAAGREEAEDILFGDDPSKLLKLLTGLLDKRTEKYGKEFDTLN